MNRFFIELDRKFAQELRFLFGIENELAPLAARQASEGRSLFGQGRDTRADVGCQLRSRDDAVAVQIRPPFQTLEQGPGKNRMAVWTIIRNLLVRAAGGEHLAGGAA